MKTFLKILSVLVCVGLVTACQKQETSSAPTIGIVVPLEHKAMDEIVAGFSETLKSLYHQPVIIKVENAQNDPNLERAIISQMRDQNMSLIIPIGTDASQMTIATVHNTPIVSLAAELPDSARKQLKDCKVAIVHDEIPASALIEFIHQAYPNLKQLTLVHSASNKIFPEVSEAIAAGKQDGIVIKDLMVSSLPELTSAANNLSDDTQGIFILKDSLIVSGVSTLANVAKQRHIPLITSDQGSVQSGADFALGVHEKQIGVEGGKIAASILNGTPACDIPVVEMKTLTVFVNQQAMNNTGQTTSAVTDAAKKLNYVVEYTGT